MTYSQFYQKEPTDFKQGVHVTPADAGVWKPAAGQEIPALRPEWQRVLFFQVTFRQYNNGNRDDEAISLIFYS